MAARTHARAVELGEHSGPLHLVAFSDWRVQDISLLVEEISKFPTKPDLILYGGDDISRFRERGKNLFEHLARCSNYGICAVAGNDDLPGHQKDITGHAVFDVHASPVILGDFAVLGVEGAPSAPGFLLHGEREISSHLARQKRTAKRKNLILVSHCPPAGCLDKSVRFSLDGKPRSIGSRAVRKFVYANKRVRLVVCGHSHRCGGRHQKFGRTVVVNAASRDDVGSVGRFAVITVRAHGKLKVEWREIREVACIPGIKDRCSERLRASGIRTVQEFAECEMSALAAALPHPPPRPLEVLKARARALLEERPVLIRPMTLPPNPEIFLDVETDSAGGYNYVWLIGSSIGRKGPYQAFFAETPAEEHKILTAFLEFAAGHPTANFLAFSASKLEERVLHRRLSFHGLSTSVCSKIVNICQSFQQSVALPIDSESVKGIAEMLGFRSRHPGLDGWGVALLYEHDYIRAKSGVRRKVLKRKLLEYSEDDVRSLPFILDAVANLAPGPDVASPVTTGDQQTA